MTATAERPEPTPRLKWQKTKRFGTTLAVVGALAGGGGNGWTCRESRRDGTKANQASVDRAENAGKAGLVIMFGGLIVRFIAVDASRNPHPGNTHHKGKE